MFSVSCVQKFLILFKISLNSKDLIRQLSALTICSVIIPPLFIKFGHVLQWFDGRILLDNRNLIKQPGLSSLKDKWDSSRRGKAAGA
jgi:hypothetical protein